MADKNKGFCAPEFPRAGRPPGITNAETQSRRLAVEALMTQRLPPAEIHRRIGQRFTVTLRTVKNDMKTVYQSWSDRLKATTKNSQEEYMAALLQIRDRAWNGRPVMAPDGVTVASRVERDSRLALECEREIAKLTGAVGPDPVANVEIHIERAETIVQQLIGVVFRVVKDDDTRAFIKDETAKLLQSAHADVE